MGLKFKLPTFCLMKDLGQPNFDDPVHDPANYRMGIFYYCRKDERLMPKKHHAGSGWEINYAHRSAPFLLISLIAGAGLLSAGCILLASWLMKF